MDITGIYGSDASQQIDPSELFKKWADNKVRKTSGDTVSISEEGRKKAEELAMSSLNGATDGSGAQTDGISAGGGGGGTSSAINQNAEEQTQEMESKIKALMDQLMSIMQGSLSPEEKIQQSQPIQQQISQLQTQLNELKSESKQKS